MTSNDTDFHDVNGKSIHIVKTCKHPLYFIKPGKRMSGKHCKHLIQNGGSLFILDKMFYFPSVTEMQVGSISVGHRVRDIFI